MSKFLFLIAVLATVVAGCSQEEEVITSRDINDAITFEAYTGRTPVSRTAQITKDNHNIFYVFATQHDGEISENTLCDGFMSNVEVSRTIGGGHSSRLVIFTAQILGKG